MQPSTEAIPVKAGCFQPVPATVQTSTAPSSKLLKSSLKFIGINKFVESDAFSCFSFAYLICTGF